MRNLPEGVLKYLCKYSLPEWKLESNFPPNIETVIVVPALSEFYGIQRLLESLLGNDKKHFSSTLVIFVVNDTVQSSDEIKENNRKSIEYIRNIINHKIESGFIKKVISSGLNFGIVDAASKGNEFPRKNAGAGLARKIGMDLALTAFDYSINRKKIIISLDADCTVSKNYLTNIIDNFKRSDLSAAVIKLEHRIVEGETTAAIICYEIFLRYYVLGLKLADSPFAFQTVGSAMAFDYKTYIKAEGMNKRKAGEDFYFLQKIAKRIRIEEIKSTTVFPSSRISWRVPFGTGPRIKRFISEIKNEYLLYNPESFIILKKWLDKFRKPGVSSSQEYLEVAKYIHPLLHQFLILNDFENAWKKITDNSKLWSQIEKQKSDWFDGFRTLKLIHYLRDNKFPLIDMFDALDNILTHFNNKPEIKRRPGEIPPMPEQIVYLKILRKLT